MTQFATKLVGAASALAASIAMVLPIAAHADSSGPKYVSMGSSYAAGPGVGIHDPASGLCARSETNYAELVAKKEHLNLMDVACSGGTTKDILTRHQHGFAPQISAVDADTRLVTVTIGGNDVNYVDNLFGYTCKDTGGQNCKIVPNAEVEKHFAELPGDLRKVADEVHSRAPDAKLIFVSYLPLMVDEGSGSCAQVPLTAAYAEHMRSIEKRFNKIIEDTAAETHALVVRGEVIGKGHEACSSEPYLAGYNPPLNPAWTHPVKYHPNQAGMNRIAEAVEQFVEQ